MTSTDGRSPQHGGPAGGGQIDHRNHGNGSRCGADVLSLDWRVNLRKLRELLGPGVALQGNVDPAILLGPAEQVRNATLAAAETLNGVGHILNLGHGILPATPVENARIFIETGQRTEIGTVRPVGLSR